MCFIKYSYNLKLIEFNNHFSILHDLFSNHQLRNHSIDVLNHVIFNFKLPIYYYLITLLPLFCLLKAPLNKKYL